MKDYNYLNGKQKVLVFANIMIELEFGWEVILIFCDVTTKYRSVIGKILTKLEMFKS